MIISIFLPNVGCKARCVFCNQYSMTGERLPSKKSLLETLNHFSRREQPDEIAFYGGTFTGIPLQKQKEYFDIVKSVFPNTSIRISTRPDELTEENLKFLKENNVKVVEIGIQSMFDDVLEASNRGHTRKDNIEAIQLLKKYDFEVSAHLMIGLPNDDFQKDLCSLKELLEIGLRIFRIHPTIIFKNTVLEKEYLAGNYKPLTLEEAIDISSEMLLLVYQYNAKVIRLGYFVPESQKKQIVAGPYHPSFGDITKAKTINKIVNRLNIKKAEFPKRFESWFNSYENKKLKIEKVISNEFRFDGMLLSEAAEVSFRKELLLCD